MSLDILLCSLLLTISMRGRESLQFILQSLAPVFLRFSCPVQSCLVRSSVMSRVFALFGYSATTPEIQLWRSLYTDGCSIRRARVRKGGQMLAKPIKFQIVDF